MGSNENAIYAALRTLSSEQRTMAIRHLTVEDLRQLFIPAHLRHSLKEAFGVASPRFADQELVVEVTMDNSERNLSGNDKLLATFKWDHTTAPEGFFVPREGRCTLQQDISDELRDKWNYVGDSLARISWEFGLVTETFKQLNTNGFCNTPAQMRYVWPAIRHIADKAKLRDLHLEEASARAGDRARVPVQIQDFLVPTVNIINRTLLIDKVEPNERPEFRLNVNAPGYVVTPKEGVSVLFSGAQ
jgi:hypothetical protein